jgi:hypothetical protein
MEKTLAQRLKELARAENRTFTDLIEEAAMDLLAKRRTPRPRERIVLPTAGDPNKRLTGEQLDAAAARAQFEYDMKKLGLEPRADSRH